MTTFVKVGLGLSKLSPADKAIIGQSIKDAMQSSGNFSASNMPIPYPSIQTIITNLHNATVAASNGTTADTAYMHEQERIFVSAFNFLKAHVEMVANNSTSPVSIITSAGMQVAASGGFNAVSELTLEATGNGKLQVRVPRQIGEKAFIYESSADGTTWVEFATGTVTKVTLANQTPGSTVYIRYYAINKTGKSSYSQVKSAIVV